MPKKEIEAIQVLGGREGRWVHRDLSVIQQKAQSLT
jgi:hypothetical protein